MASSSSSSFASGSQYCPRWEYDVFLSFRGADTQRTFTGHLFERLKNRGIFAFQDDKRLEEGDSISEEFMKVIEESQFGIIVFSKNYAASRWCLDELVKIMECMGKNGQTVIPVFYDVDPSQVRKQTTSFAEAFDKHESRYKDDVEGMQKVQAWRTALTAAANLKGYDIGGRIESECIRELIDNVSSKLCKTSLSYLQHIVGIDTHLEKVKSLLEMEIDDVRILGIWGMGGVGKTTIARAIFDTLSPQFQSASFLPRVNQINTKEMHSLQNILLSDLLREDNKYVNNKEEGKHLMPHRLHSMKVLVVLDDINHHDHWEYLAGDLHWFGSGSRIIATTRNKQIIGKNNAVYEVATLLEHDAIRLFNHYAFRDEAPDEHFKKLTLEVVNHAKGLPLALKVWSSLLYRRSLTQWRSAIDRIKKNYCSQIVESLKISYDGLEPQEQEMFLDIACFFRGDEKKKVMQILESCDFEAEYGLNVLIEKSLVFLTEDDTIEMHDLMQGMGKYIVRIQKDAGVCSRIWDYEDFKEVMVNNTGTKAIEAIWIQEIQDLSFRKNLMKDMEKLRILYINGFHTHDCSNDQYLPSNLRWFDCCKYPWKSLPAKFDPDRLVHLDLQQSPLLHLWAETERKFPFLRRLDLSGCANLIRTPNFTDMPNLEYLGLEGCSNLKKVHSSLRRSRKLIKLNLRDCKSLERFKYVSCESLEYLYIQGCSSLKDFPRIRGKMKPTIKIHVQRSGIRNLPSAIIQHQYSLTELDLSGMKNLATLPCNIGKLKCLVKLKVSYCSKLKSLPEEIGDLENLEILKAKYTLISQPPSSIVRLNRLKFLNLSYCNLKDGGLPEDIGCLSSLEVLNLRGNNFEHLPQSIARLGSLQSLDLLDCKRLTLLPEFPRQLCTIYADWSNDSICNSLFQNISSFQHDSCASDSLSLRVSTNEWKNIPGWFHHQGKDKSVSVKLPENWYVCDDFLGFAVCYSGCLIETTVQLLCDDGMPCITQNLGPSNHSEEFPESAIHFFLVPLAALWDTSKANGKTPNDYRHITLSFSDELKDFGLRLLYKDESKLKASLQMTENNDESTEYCIVKRRGRYDGSICSPSKKHRSQL